MRSGITTKKSRNDIITAREADGRIARAFLRRLLLLLGTRGREVTTDGDDRLGIMERTAVTDTMSKS
jgi:hypothetical protein